MEKQKRKSIRLPDYDYSAPGAYFVTICVHEHKCMLASVKESSPMERASVRLTEAGKCADLTLRETAEYHGVRLDSYVIMPNHIHMILFTGVDTSVSLGRFIGAYKSVAAKRWREYCNRKGMIAGKLWQRNYYDHILRNEADYLEKRKYIEDNPDKWSSDDLYTTFSSV